MKPSELIIEDSIKSIYDYEEDVFLDMKITGNTQNIPFVEYRLNNDELKKASFNKNSGVSFSVKKEILDISEKSNTLHVEIFDGDDKIYEKSYSFEYQLPMITSVNMEPTSLLNEEFEFLVETQNTKNNKLKVYLNQEFMDEYDVINNKVEGSIFFNKEG